MAAMNDFRPEDMAAYRREPVADNASMDSDRADIFLSDENPNQIVTFAPKERFRLGYFDVMCLVINRMIGTGIFNSPQRVMRGTNSTGASLLLWFAGIIYCLSGTHVYIEYGLNVPRYTIDGEEQSVPRSGGDLNYLQYVYRKPGYRKNTILLSTCLFGVGFIALGNMAGNSISFAIRVLEAADYQDPTNATVRGIAIATAILTCFIHTFSRRFGLWINNMLAMIKTMILLLIIVVAIIVGANGLPKTENHVTANTSTSKSFDGASKDANGYAGAFLAIIFSMSGFEQPNYVMGEISHPRRKFPIASILGVSIVLLLYMAVNISYMVVVPAYDQIHGDGSVAQQFFELSLGSLASGNTGKRIFNAFLAISSMGNIIVMTYTAARVKQEIAKEGILPFAKFFAQNKDLSLGRVLRWFQTKGWFGSVLRWRWFAPEEHTEQTPVGAFVLHFVSCLILIFATWGLTPDNAYNLLTNLSSYVINGFFGSFLGLGILILRFKGPPVTESTDDHHQALPVAPPSWRTLTGKHINPVLSVLCATIYLVGNLFPVVTKWIKPTTALKETLTWWLVPTISWVIIAIGVAWFIGFVGVARRIDRKHHKVFIVEKKPEFESADGSSRLDPDHRNDSGLVLVHETVYLSWVGRETLRARQTEDMTETSDVGKQPTAVETTVSGSDFAAFFQGQNQQPPMQQSHYPPMQQSQYQQGQPAYPPAHTNQYQQGQNQYPQGQPPRGFSTGHGY